jgi:hypothetical protein
MSLRRAGDSGYYRPDYRFQPVFSTSIDPQRAELTVGPGFPNEALGSFYKGISGPTFITSTRNTVASSGVGGPAGVVGEFHWLVVPFDHVSGMPLSATATFDNTTISDLGVPPGIYTWTWGSGTHVDSLKLFAGVPIPELGTLGLLTLGAAGLALLKWRSSI